MFASHNLYNLTSEQPYILSPNLTSKARTIQQHAQMTSTKVVTVYATEKGWLAGGFVVMCLACLAIVSCSIDYIFQSPCCEDPLATCLDVIRNRLTFP